MTKAPRVVAELGRPETPDETAARKAESRRKHHANQTVVNLILSLIASVALVAFIVLVVLRFDPPTPAAVDVDGPAADASELLDVPVLAPEVPESWHANAAELRPGAAGITTWYVGWVTADEQFASLTQGVGADASWLAATTDNATPDDELTIDGVVWQVADQRDTQNPGNQAYLLWTETETSSIVLAGTADDDEMRALAEATSAQLTAD